MFLQPRYTMVADSFSRLVFCVSAFRGPHVTSAHLQALVLPDDLDVFISDLDSRFIVLDMHSPNSVSVVNRVAAQGKRITVIGLVEGRMTEELSLASHGLNCVGHLANGVLPSESAAEIERFVLSAMEPAGSPGREAILKSVQHASPGPKKTAAKRSFAEVSRSERSNSDASDSNEKENTTKRPESACQKKKEANTPKNQAAAGGPKQKKAKKPKNQPAAGGPQQQKANKPKKKLAAGVPQPKKWNQPLHNFWKQTCNEIAKGMNSEGPWWDPGVNLFDTAVAESMRANLHLAALNEVLVLADEITTGFVNSHRNDYKLKKSQGKKHKLD